MRYHFSGIAGAGLSPLARLMAARGHSVQGSDRGIDQGQNLDLVRIFQAAGISLHPQDGSGLSKDVGRFIHSTAVEPDTAEMRRANELGLATTARPAFLAECINGARPGVAIAGTSGKSTVVGMIAWICQECQRPATILGGAALAESGATHMGCFNAADADQPLIAEACESDGTLTGYHPSLGLIHNITRDHDELPGLMAQFASFAGQCDQLLLNAACPQAASFSGAKVRRYSSSSEADLRLDIVRDGPWRAQGSVHDDDGSEFFLDLPQPGRHNLDNALAALAVCQTLGIPLDVACSALSRFPGVARRYQILGRSPDGITVIDDYAHNADKIRAAISTAQAACNRLLAIFQPHGFGPARFLRSELAELLPRLLRPQDRFCYAGIFYAGGSVSQDISSADLAADLPGSAYARDHAVVLEWATATAIPGDCILLMGARDPSLPGLARSLCDLL